MVTKPVSIVRPHWLQFESCVVLDGDKTAFFRAAGHGLFESCVVLDGDKTNAPEVAAAPLFESCVVLIMYNKLRKRNRHGIQAADRIELQHKHSKGA